VLDHLTLGILGNIRNVLCISIWGLLLQSLRLVMLMAEC
jgi:hypothetical protein